MMRHRAIMGRSVPVPALLLTYRLQSGGRNNNNNNNNNNDNNNKGHRDGGRGNPDDVRMHRFIRENTPSRSGSEETIRTEFDGLHAQNQPRQGRGGGGGGNNTRQQQRQFGGSGGGRPTPLGTGEGTIHSASAADWAVQLEKELLSEGDALGGLGHKDYYRDPQQGFSPQYAPRNYARGGELAYPHGRDTAAAQRRVYLEHDTAAYSASARDERSRLRSIADTKERAAYLAGLARPEAHARFTQESPSTSVVDQLQLNTGGSSIDNRRKHAMVSRYQNSESARAASPVLGGGADGSLQELTQSLAEQNRVANDRMLEEQLRIEHGLRAKERFDFDVLQRRSRNSFVGYDMDRHKAQQKGKAYGAGQLPPGVPISSMEEAQKNLRSTPKEERQGLEAQAQSVFLRNTVTDTPKVGEGLTEEVMEAVRAQRSASERHVAQERKQKFGLGRQHALVQDGGPDQRTIKRQTNDERLVNALNFSSNAYRKTTVDEHTNPYTKRNTERGVGHLLNNAFDIARREDRISRGEQDLTEREMLHYGTPVQQTIDDFVFRHRNARGERSLDYFKPFPDIRAQRLYQVYQDTEGFPLMKQRPEFLEWELFVRYRAHHQQRRDLALQHGLEPAANETAGERDARRARLDELCESTPFDAARYLDRRHDDEASVSAETLRQWFGVYLLPSPSVTAEVLRAEGAYGLHLNHAVDELGKPDTREHVMSSRYFNTLLLNEGFTQRIAHSNGHALAGKAPDPTIKHAQSPDVLRTFTPEERVMYDEYVSQETQRQKEEWERLSRRRRWLPEKGQYGEVIHTGAPVEVMDVQQVEKLGPLVTVAYSELQQQVEAGKESVVVDGEEYTPLRNTRRIVTPISVRLESGEVLETTSDAFSRYPLEVAASARYNHHLDFGVAEYSYNRGNYVETQDVLWEAASAAQTEGWSPATHADGLRPGLPVRARRCFSVAAGSSSSAEEAKFTVYPIASGADRVGAVSPAVKGDYQRARVVRYYHQPFFNPEPRTVTVEFEADGAVADVPLDDVMIWQRQYYGPDRTRGDETRRYNPAGPRRYVDVADPHNEKAPRSLSVGGTEHFLAKYETREARETTRNKSRSTKEITELDQWTKFDNRRAENYRPLSISHRRDYIRLGYMHRYTPWEWIAVQEADQPVIHETIRRDDVGSSFFFSPNRYWRYKARPHGYLRNYEREVRDLIQYVDGVTPWKQAQKIRTYWEVRQHHPMPQFNRPEVAMHRNTANMLPTHLWETDKKSGKVKGVKDSVRDYQTKAPIPTWVQL